MKDLDKDILEFIVGMIALSIFAIILSVIKDLLF